MSAALQGSAMRYLAVGHVTIDLLGGEAQPGGTALYAALQAARLGLEATIVTRGEPAQLREMLSPFAPEVELIVQPADETTTFETEGSALSRRQRLRAWAGPIDARALPAAEILHLAPVAAEVPAAVPGAWPFVGVTPQGFARRWDGIGAHVTARRANARLALAAGRCDAVVVSSIERDSCAELVDAALAAGAVAAVTAGAEATELLASAGAQTVPVEPVPDPVDDLGAGDVYAAVLFVALARGARPADAARSAAAAASLRMAGAGPAAVATRAAIEARVGRLR